ncbi:Gar1/Naf1 family protein [uncultured Methanobrevibacter sp.]|uniref:Gar1/Naf1 family protein n=1 Tax=uncultured Methanobrevibacter sp. TaxID=253161 RepID=UPI0026E09589|nr:Gar1/Naf1 family protein [uncultured Methanobrevibacter sp.]
MKFLGNSLHIANSGKLIARGSKTPNAGGIVFDSEKNKIGKINYIFGPTKNPYISIRLFKSANIKRLQKNYGEKLFVSRPKQKKSKGRGRRPRNKK